MLTLIRVVIGLQAIALFSQFKANGLKCYTDVEGTQITRCKENEGFRTCFTKYNDTPVGQVTGRGCSTKDKVFYKECETHQSDQVEIMCFCSYFLCNGSSIPTKTAPNVLTFLWFIILVAVLNRILNTSVYTQYHVCQSILGSKKKSKKLRHSKQVRKSLDTEHQNRMLSQENVHIVFDVFWCQISVIIFFRYAADYVKTRKIVPASIFPSIKYNVHIFL
jgi:hypothetical protein